jgi:hypothetical protein
MIRPTPFLIVSLDSNGKYHQLTASANAVCGMVPDHIWIFGMPKTKEEIELYTTVYPVASFYGNRLTHINTNDYSKDPRRQQM